MPSESYRSHMHFFKALKPQIFGTLFVSLTVLLTACGGTAATQIGAIGAHSIPNVATAQSSITQPVQPSPVPSTQVNTIQPLPVTGPSDTRPVHVNINYVLPTTPLRTTQSATQRKLQYIAPTNTQISITVTPLGGSSTIYGPTACTSGSCAISFMATPGPNTIAFVLTDGTNTLSRFSTTTIVQPATINTLNFTANPVVNSVVLSLTSATVSAGTAFNDLVTVAAKDLGGNTIVGNNNYVDINGNPVTLFLGASNSQAGGSGTVALQGSTRITSPSQAATYAHYDGNWLSSSNISVTSTSSAITTLTGTTLSISPSIAATYTTITSNSNPRTLVSGPDGTIWFTEFNTNKIGRITMSGAVTEYTIPTAGSQPCGLTLCSDGALWFTEYNATKIGRMTTAGVFTEYNVPTGGSFPNGVTSAPDGSIWFVESSVGKIGKITVGGTVTEYNVPSGNGTFNLTVGSDGAIWFTEFGGNKIGRSTLDGMITEYTVPSVGAQPAGITAGSDGALWFTEYGTSKMGRVTTSGVFTEYTLPTANAGPANNATTGPDGAIWFSERTANKIGRITTAGVITEYPLSVGSGPDGIVTGPDGAIWFAQSSTNHIGRLVF